MSAEHTDCSILDNFLVSAIKEATRLLDQLTHHAPPSHEGTYDDPLIVAMAGVATKLEEAHLQLRQALAGKEAHE